MTLAKEGGTKAVCVVAPKDGYENKRKRWVGAGEGLSRRTGVGGWDEG